MIDPRKFDRAAVIAAAFIVVFGGAIWLAVGSGLFG